MSNTTDVAIIEQPNTRDLRPFSSIEAADLDTRFQLASAVMGATPLADRLGVPFNIAHIVRHPVEVKNDKTGEITLTYRTTLVTDEGTAFSATSRGVDVAVDNILAAMGSPATWEGRSFPFLAEKRGSGNSAYITLVPVAAAKKTGK